MAEQTAQPDHYSVSDALLIAKTGLESIRIKIVGEVSELSDKRGYKAVYFTIKDAKSALPCLMWKNKYDAAGVEISIGSMVEISGKFSLYAAKGRMNFDVDSINLAGEGELRLQVARLAKKLEAEGLCDPAKKLPIPSFPKKIGLVTSPRGAVVHDVIRTLNRRMPTSNVVFAGVAVEGNNAPTEMIKALDAVEGAGVDVIILCRGGGSFEDLMPFNDEALARRIAASQTPIVSGIGHEPDTTIADLVSDFRASTPTGAAEAVSVDSKELVANYSAHLNNIKTGIIGRVKVTSEKLEAIASRPIFADGTKLFEAEFQTLDYNQEKLTRLLGELSKKYENQISLASAKLHDKSPLVILARGYSAAKDSSGKIVKNISQVKAGDKLSVRVSDGQIDTNVESTIKLDGDSI